MQVIIHAGVHCTDEDRLVKCLLRNIQLLRDNGVHVPGPGRYRGVLAEALNAATHAPLAPDAREVLLEEILDEDPAQVERLILSDPGFFAPARRVLAWNAPYARAGEKLGYLRQMFHGDEVELYLGLRDPAAWLPAVYAASGHEGLAAFLGEVDPLEFRWSEMIHRIRHDVPEVPITVWCNEDTPLIWGEIVRDIAGLDPNQKITGAFDILASIMSVEGNKRFRAFLADHKVMTEMQKRRVMAAFLDKFALDEEIEEEVTLPGWTEELVATMSEGYEEDIWTIGRMPGVTLIAP